MIAIVDYGAGNLTSVMNAFAALDAKAKVVSDAASVDAADRVVFPGVGAAGKAMENLRSRGLAEAVRRAAAEKPFLGICLGMQILFDHTDEDGGVDCLGLIGGKVSRFPDEAGFKVPEIGWNDVEWVNGERGTGNGEWGVLLCALLLCGHRARDSRRLRIRRRQVHRDDEARQVLGVPVPP